MWKSASSSEGSSVDHKANPCIVLSRILLAAGAVSLTVCIVFAVDVGQNYQRAVAKDDFAGFSLGMHFLLYGLAPLTLSLFLAACLLDPPMWLVRRLGIRASTSRSFLTLPVIVLCLAGAAGILLYVVFFVGQNLVGAARHYGYGIRGLAVVLLQNLVFSSPLLILAWAARALGRLRSTV